MSEENKPLGFEEMDTDDLEQVAGGNGLDEACNHFVNKILYFISYGSPQCAQGSYLQLMLMNPNHSSLAYIRRKFRDRFGYEIDG